MVEEAAPDQKRSRNLSFWGQKVFSNPAIIPYLDSRVYAVIAHAFEYEVDEESASSCSRKKFRKGKKIIFNSEKEQKTAKSNRKL